MTFICLFFVYKGNTLVHSKIVFHQEWYMFKVENFFPDKFLFIKTQISEQFYLYTLVQKGNF